MFRSVNSLCMLDEEWLVFLSWSFSVSSSPKLTFQKSFQYPLFLLSNVRTRSVCKWVHFFVTTRSLVNIPTRSYYFSLVVRTFILLATFKYTVYSIMNYRHLAVQYIHFWLLFFFLILNCCGCSVAKSCPTLWDPMDCSRRGFPVLHYLPEFAQIHVHWVNDAI